MVKKQLKTREVVEVFRNHIGKPIWQVMEAVNISDDDFSDVFEALVDAGTPNDNQTVITPKLIALIRNLK
jgi:predicted transcriptional regulator